MTVFVIGEIKLYYMLDKRERDISIALGFLGNE